MQYFKTNFKVVIAVLLMAVASCSFTAKNVNDPDKDKLLIDLITYVLERGHYEPSTINDEFSGKVYEDYLTAIDPMKRFFYAEDEQQFAAYREQLDDQIKGQELAFFDLTHKRLQQRMKEVRGIYKEILAEPFDFSQEEEINTDYEEVSYAGSREELKERWRKQLKFNTLSTFYDKKKMQEKALEKDPEAKVQSDAELEKEARETTRTTIEEYFDFSEELERKDYFTVYVNAIVEEFDPHTFYFAPQDKDRFDIAMSGKLEGIGARLQKKGDDIVIMEVISGGPAWMSDEISEGDVILKVKQEDEENPVSVVGMRLDDAVSLIKGPKGTKVTLTIKKKITGNIEEVTLTRDVVELEETYAKSAMVKRDERNFGVINLPKFYFNMENYNERNAASDVVKEINSMKKQGLEGLVIDLRNNGGGSLKTVVDIAGLFIDRGPVVQVKSKEGGREILSDTDRGILWDGPLVILVNELSASASEILAAAMQDYQRAIVLGSKQTYGKGTVQNVIDLNQTIRSSEYGDLGALKLTTQKFYRVNGGSTQLEGVKSDVVLPDRYMLVDIGEKDYENPLPWDQIEPARYNAWQGYVNYEQTLEKSKERVDNNEQLNLIRESAQWVKEQRDKDVYSLNYKVYSEERRLSEQEAKRFDAISNYKSNLTYKSLPEEQEMFKSDTTLKEKRDRWHKNLSSDVYVEEALNVLEDIRLNNEKRSKVAELKK